jgi:hypothetical protein
MRRLAACFLPLFAKTPANCGIRMDPRLPHANALALAEASIASPQAGRVVATCVIPAFRQVDLRGWILRHSPEQAREMEAAGCGFSLVLVGGREFSSISFCAERCQTKAPCWAQHACSTTPNASTPT